MVQLYRKLSFVLVSGVTLFLLAACGTTTMTPTIRAATILEADAQRIAQRWLSECLVTTNNRAGSNEKERTSRKNSFLTT